MDQIGLRVGGFEAINEKRRPETEVREAITRKRRDEMRSVVRDDHPIVGVHVHTHPITSPAATDNHSMAGYMWGVCDTPLPYRLIHLIFPF